MTAHDISFSVPFVHRLRFTFDIAGDDFKTLLDLLEPGGDAVPKVMIVVDQDLLEACPAVDALARRLDVCGQVQLVRADESPIACVLQGGEAVKNDSAGVDRLLSLINQHDLDRRSYVIAIGGGAVLDAAGYAAAIAHRGVRLIRLPSTTLAQDDSGVGVKNAINYFGKKNWVGTFAVPWAVINDRSLIQTLPDRDFRCGFSEAVKVSLLKSREDFDFLCDHAKQIADRDMDIAFDAIRRSCLWHLKHITQGGDPFEALEARPLDFGHWSAHKMEPLSGYRIRHGEAVGIGVALDCIYSSKVHGMPMDQAMAVCRCMHDLGLPLWDQTLDQAQVLMDGLEEFRQHLGGRLTVTMLRGVGEPIDVHDIDKEAMLESVLDLKRISHSLAPAAC
ncbi:MAG: 3-dehydroquinate synthase [Planctomycetota bacterium]